MSLDAGNAACTTGLSAELFLRRVGVAPASAAGLMTATALSNMQAACYAEALATANKINALYTDTAYLLVGNGVGSFTALAPGAAGEVLTSGGPGAPLAWAPGGGGGAPPGGTGPVEVVAGAWSPDPVTLGAALQVRRVNAGAAAMEWWTVPIDGAAGTASLRTLGAGATQAMAGNATPTPAAHAASHIAGDAIATATPNPGGSIGLLSAADKTTVDDLSVGGAASEVWTAAGGGGAAGWAAAPGDPRLPAAPATDGSTLRWDAGAGAWVEVMDVDHGHIWEQPDPATDPTAPLYWFDDDFAVMLLRTGSGAGAKWVVPAGGYFSTAMGFQANGGTIALSSAGVPTLAAGAASFVFLFYYDGGIAGSSYECLGGAGVDWTNGFMPYLWLNGAAIELKCYNPASFLTLFTFGAGGVPALTVGWHSIACNITDATHYRFSVDGCAPFDTGALAVGYTSTTAAASLNLGCQSTYTLTKGKTAEVGVKAALLSDADLQAVTTIPATATGRIPWTATSLCDAGAGAWYHRDGLAYLQARGLINPLAVSSAVRRVRF